MANDKYKIGDITAQNVAVGSRPTVTQAVYHPAAQPDALASIRSFAALLPAYADQLKDYQAVLDETVAAKADLAKKKPKRERIEAAMSRITVAVAGVTALANAIEAVQASVSRLFS